MSAETRIEVGRVRAALLEESRKIHAQMGKLFESKDPEDHDRALAQGRLHPYLADALLGLHGHDRLTAALARMVWQLLMSPNPVRCRFDPEFLNRMQTMLRVSMPSKATAA